MTIPAEVLNIAVDNLAVPQMIRNHSGNRGAIDWRGATPVASSSAGSYGGNAFRLITGSGVNFLESVRYPVTPGFKLEVAYKSAVVAGTGTTVLSGAIQYYDTEGRDAGSANVSSAVGDVLQVLTVPAGAAYAQVSLFNGSATGVQFDIAKVTLRQAATAAELTAAPAPEAWLNITGKSVSATIEYGNSLEGVEDVLDPGIFTAVVRDSSIDPSTNPTIRRGRRVVVTALDGTTTRYVWEGRLESVDATYETDGATVVTLTGTDTARVLNDSDVSTVTDDTGAIQINRTTARIGIASFDGTAMPASSSSSPVLARGENVKAAEWVKRICNTSSRRAWVDNRNVLQQRSVAELSTAPAVTFSDRFADVGAIYYTDVALNYGSLSCVNALSVVRHNVDEVFDNGDKTYGPYIASSSEAANGRISASLDILSGSPSAAAAAVLPVFASPTIFPTSVTLNAMDDLTKALALAPYQAARVKRVGIYDKVVRALRIRHEITAKRWITTVYFRPLETAGTGVIVTNPAAGADTGPAENVIVNTKPLASRTRTAAQSVATSSTTPGYTTISWDNGISSAGITYDATAREFTVPRSGRYDVNISVEWAAATGGIRRAYLRINGSAVTRKTDSASGTDNTTNVITWSGRLNAGDKLRVDAYQDSGSSKNIAFSETSVQIKFAD